MLSRRNSASPNAGAVPANDATVMRAAARPEASTIRPVTGAGIALDVLITAIAGGVCWWLSENVPLTVIIAVEVLVLALFVWRITGTTPGSLIARLAFGIGAAPAVSEDETRLAVQRVSDRGFADAVADDSWMHSAAQAAAGAYPRHDGQDSAAAPLDHAQVSQSPQHDAAPFNPQTQHYQDMQHQPGMAPGYDMPAASPQPVAQIPAQNWPNEFSQPQPGQQQPGQQLPGQQLPGQQQFNAPQQGLPASFAPIQHEAAPLPSPVSGSEPKRHEVIAFEPSTAGAAPNAGLTSNQVSSTDQARSAAQAHPADQTHSGMQAHLGMQAQSRANTPIVALPSGERVALNEQPLLVGRKPRPEHGEIPIALEDETRSISRSHLMIIPRDQGPVVTDLGSANGTRVRRDGQEFPVVQGNEFPLQLGDTILLGRFELELQ